MPALNPRILIVDDETAIARIVQFRLSSDGMEAITTHSGADALAILATQSIDLVILDIMMPEMDGFTTLRRIRQRSAVPVLMLAASTLPADGVRALTDGADDFLTKPFNPEELSLRVELLLRRVARGETSDGRLRYGDVTIDHGLRRVMRGSVEVRLSRTEWAVLMALVNRMDTVVPHEDLVTAVWGEEYRGEGGYARTWVARLRAKLGEGVPILSVTGAGYRLVSPEWREEARCTTG